MAQGTIKTLVNARGVGFILPADAPPTGQDLFVHRADVHGTSYEKLREGESVTYDLITDERRGTPRATNVQSDRGRDASV